MAAYLVRRLLLAIPALVGVSVAVFLLMRAVPGDVAQAILVGPQGEGGSVSQERYAKLRAELHLDRPLFIDLKHPSHGSQYGEWTWGFIRGDWGKSVRTTRPILSDISNRFPLTFELATFTMVIAIGLAIPLGILMATRQDSWVDYVARLFSIGGLAMPSFWVSALMLVIMTKFFQWSPPVGYARLWEHPWANIKQMIWPCLSLGYLLAAIIARMTRSSLLDVLRQDYIRTAWSKGLHERVIIYRHALKNAMLPVVTIVGLQYAALMGGTVVMERLWNLPGVGFSLIDAIIARDYPVVQALVMLFAVIILVSNLIVDMTYAWLDPRVRFGHGR